MSADNATYIVVGSGASGVHATQTLLESGKRVTMIDVGISNMNTTKDPDTDFLQLRKGSSDQHRLFLGDRFEGVFSDNKSGTSGMTPQRLFVTDRVGELTPLQSSSFFPVESLAAGGLGEAWGLGCVRFSDAELERCGLPANEMNPAYQVIADRIGIAYGSDDIEKYTTGGLNGLQPSIRVDENASRLLDNYNRKRTRLNNSGITLGKASLALLTQDKSQRKATAYNDLDFYANHGQSAWRPSITLEHLKTFPSFTYHAGLLVKSFTEIDGGVSVKAIDVNSNDAVVFSCHKLIIACNVAGTTRIVARSQKAYDHRFPLLCNSYAYAPCLQPSMIGKELATSRTSTAQLMMFHDGDGQNRDVAAASIYSYGSLLLFRIINHSPFGYKESRKIMQWLSSAFVITGIHHPDEQAPGKYLQLIKNQNGDLLTAEYQLSTTEREKQRKRSRFFLKALRKLGCYSLKMIETQPGASIHYAGTLPYSKNENAFTLSPEGRLSHTKNIYVADGSGLCYLPAKGITFTLMANAHRTALHAMKNE
jgi:hypothetical protein